MPNCFTLTRKSNPEAGPVVLTVIDEEMCAHFGVACHPTQWHHHWYDIIGLYLAYGKTFDWMRQTYKKDIEDGKDDGWMAHSIEIIDWLDANFTSDAWAEIGRR